MRWTKLGIIVSPQPDVWWMSHYAGPSFVRESADGWVIYVTGRDANNVSRIGRLYGKVQGDTFHLDVVEAEPIFDVGDLGTFDESGVSYPWLLEVQNKLLMYYVGWVAGGRNRFQNFTGLAYSEDDGSTWQRNSRVPLLDRSHEEPYGTGSCCVYRDGDQFSMVYTAFQPWVPSAIKNRPTYNLKRAVSPDGYRWTRTGEVVIDFASEDEYVIGKPCVLEAGNIRHIWYSYRGSTYRLGYARQEIPHDFVRRDHEIGMTVSSDGWDSESVEYSHVFHSGDHVWMVYNGNDFGRTGLGLARLDGGLPDD